MPGPYAGLASAQQSAGRMHELVRPRNRSLAGGELDLRGTSQGPANEQRQNMGPVPLSLVRLWKSTHEGTRQARHEKITQNKEVECDRTYCRCR